MSKARDFLREMSEAFLSPELKAVGNFNLAGSWEKEEAEQIAKKRRGKIVQKGDKYAVAVFDMR